MILIPKPSKPLDEPSSYRAICLLNTIDKLFERVIYNRSLPIAEKEGDLSGRQFRFRKTKSTLDAVNLVRNMVKSIIEGRKYCTIVTLDVKNGYDSAR